MCLHPGRKISDQLLARRGYEPGDFVDNAPTQAATVFESAPQSGYAPLDQLFNAVDGVKKKL